jgi:hypothetical protein
VRSPARHEDAAIEELNPARQRVRPWMLAFAAVAFAITAAFGWSVLARAHPHEDAFILFKYARLLAEGYGIAYWPGGPPTEGATDFLWMVSLAGLHAIGIDVALAAVIVNGLGAGLIAVAAARLVAHERAPRVLVVAAFAFLFSGPALAAYLGFGTLFYCSILCLLFERAFRAWNESRCSASVLTLGLLAGLVRPDGVVLAVPFAIVGAIAAYRGRALVQYARYASATIVLGLAYFAWRWWYFGLPLPLPLYVKSHGSDSVGWDEFVADPLRAWPGIEPNLAWATSVEGPWPLLAGATVIVFLARRGERARLGVAALLCVLPGFVLIAALSFARQTQNVGTRFQGPALVLCLMAVIATAAFVARGGWRNSGVRGAAAVVIALGCVIPGVVKPAGNLGLLWVPRGYADTFAVFLGRELGRERVLALTEAGRLSYWTDARVEGLVGLNTIRTALDPVDLGYLSELDPDVVLFYAGPFDIRGVLGDRGALVELQRGDLARAVRPEFRADFEREIERYTRTLTPEKTAALVAARFLESNPTYAVYAVRNEGNYSHVYGFRKDLPEFPAILTALRATTARPPERISYWDAASARRAARR